MQQSRTACVAVSLSRTPVHLSAHAVTSVYLYCLVLGSFCALLSPWEVALDTVTSHSLQLFVCRTHRTVATITAPGFRAAVIRASLYSPDPHLRLLNPGACIPPLRPFKRPLSLRSPAASFTQRHHNGGQRLLQQHIIPADRPGNRARHQPPRPDRRAATASARQAVTARCVACLIALRGQLLPTLPSK